ncbi:MAG TPA: hypothetical protein VFN65_10165 [Solirubrobacteraceae bacterium]|nr:hypothetical protein [Solirubrobacteraceae bacterium]
MLALKALSRLVELLVVAAIALVGLGVGLYCLSLLVSLGGASPDRLLHLPVVRARVGHFLSQLAAPGPVAILALLGGIVAILLGLGLLIGMLGSRRERLLVVQDGTNATGGLYARQRVVSRMVRAETELTPGVTGVRRPKVRLARSGRHGRVRVLAARGADPDAATVDAAVHARLDPILEPLGLRGDIRVRLEEPRAALEAGRETGA